MKNLKSLLVMLVASMSLVACGGSDNDSHVPQLRAVHLSPDAPAVDISVNNAVVLSGVEYRQASQFLRVDEGSTDISVLVPALNNASALDATLNLEQDMKYTVIAANTVANGLPLTPIVINDDILAPTSGNADITVVAPDGELTGPVLTGISFGAISPELSLPAGDYRVRITPAASTTVVYDSGTLSLADGVEYVAVAADDVDSTNLVGLTILTDLESTAFVNVNNAPATPE